jgi:hypothetical protein
MAHSIYVKAALRADRLAVVKNMSKVAGDPNAATRDRLRAMELLLHVAIGPSNRPTDDVDVVAARDARNALSDASLPLEQIIKSRRPGRTRARAARLARLLAETGADGSEALEAG